MNTASAKGLFGGPSISAINVAILSSDSKRAIIPGGGSSRSWAISRFRRAFAAFVRTFISRR